MLPKEAMKTDQLHGVALRRTKLGVTRDGEKLPKCFVSADWLRTSGAEQARYEAYGTGGTICAPRTAA